MSYEPTNWKDGDLVTSAKLNKIEQGIAAGGGVLIVHDEDGTLDKTWQEIYDADFAVISHIEDGQKIIYPINHIGVNKTNMFVVDTIQGVLSFSASTPDDYPTFDNSEEGGSGNSPK